MMREGPFAIRPKPDDGQLLMLGRWKMDQAVHPVPDSGDSASPDVLEEKMCGVPRVGRLLRREVAGLRTRRLVEAIPVRTL